MGEVRQRLPADLEAMPPGAELAGVLESVDRRLLSDRDRVRLLRARNRLVAHTQAQLFADMYAITWSEPPADEDEDEQERLGLVRGEEEEPYPWSESEIAMALRWTHTAAGIRLEHARRLIEDLPAVHAALQAGVIDVPKALLIAELLYRLDPQVARGLAEKVLQRAGEQTTGQLRARLRRLVLAADPDAFRKRAAEGLKGRRVEVRLGEDNLAWIAGHELAPHRVAAGWERIDAIAKAARAAGDPRRMDQLRADAMLDLLIGEGIAAGGPVSNGDPYRHGGEQSSADPTEPVDEPRGTVWPAAPADPALLDPAADPPRTSPTPPPAEPQVPLPAPPPEPAPRAADHTQQKLYPYWLAGFAQLPTTRQCPRCRTAGQSAPMPAPRRGTLDLHIPLSTLAGLDQLPAELAGFGPLLADAARHVITTHPELQWRLSVYDHNDDLISHHITTTRPRSPDPPGRRRTHRRPSAETAAFVRARNRTCIAPGCRRNARRCELDHVLAWAEHGETEPDNLAPECRRHHTFKHHPGTKLTHLGHGTFTWTTPKACTTPPTPTHPSTPTPHTSTHCLVCRGCWAGVPAGARTPAFPQ